MFKLKKNEKIKDVRGYEGLYSITSYGRVWSHRRKIWLIHGIDSNGYPNVKLSIDGKATTYKIHTLVARTFIANPDGKPQINHKNGNKRDCRASNLEWVTARENLQHACDMGLISCHKLSYQDKLLICRLYSVLKVRQNKIASMFKVSPPAINYIIREYTPLIEANQNL